ncbi:hypothetical protein L1987_46772 [Smallanthus sonchifolius]|uniref:Uncharacterized protein n=1 Tax=Smallanthus sonchifolius TaxID=185202 RepID=A0ACB9G040_9ASTR|nr:hypothetical protein L1987_46772 [Smallanthus sonchifolius]
MPILNLFLTKCLLLKLQTEDNFLNGSEFHSMKNKQKKPPQQTSKLDNSATYMRFISCQDCDAASLRASEIYGLDI